MRRGSKNRPIFIRNGEGTYCSITHLDVLQAKADAIRVAQLATQRELDALMLAVLLRSRVSERVVSPSPGSAATGVSIINACRRVD